MTLTDPRALDYLERIADSLADIADALTRNRAARRVDLTPPAEPDALDDMLMAELAPRYCGAPKPGYHCTRGAHDIETPHTWTPDTETPGTIEHGAKTSCIHGEAHSDDLECEYLDPPLPVGEFHVSSLETGEPMRVVVTNRKTGATLFDGDMAKLPADLDLPQGGWSADDLVWPMADPLDESDHRARHDMDGDHWVRVTDMVDADAYWWATGGPDGSSVNDLQEMYALFGPLTFCDCEADHA